MRKRQGGQRQQREPPPLARVRKTKPTAGNREKKDWHGCVKWESFGSRIDLSAYAAAHGYQLDCKESWQGSAVMRDARGDKIIVKRNADGHPVYLTMTTAPSSSDFFNTGEPSELGRGAQETAFLAHSTAFSSSSLPCPSDNRERPNAG